MLDCPQVPTRTNTPNVLQKYFSINLSESSGGSCFLSLAKVKVKNGKSVTMSELQIGDQVQTGKLCIPQPLWKFIVSSF